jgi:hypothetical protein
MFLALFCLGVAPFFAHAQAESSEKNASAVASIAPTQVFQVTRLLALDAIREVAVFEGAQGRLVTVSRGQMLPGTDERLTRVLADAVELTQQNERQPLIYFLKIGERLPDQRAASLDAVASKNRPVPQITVQSLPIPGSESLSGRATDQPAQR